jgi:MftR C-terminal domain
VHGEYLKAMAEAERELADLIAARTGCGPLRARVLAATVSGAERAAVSYWMQTRSGALAAIVHEALEPALEGVAELS